MTELEDATRIKNHTNNCNYCQPLLQVMAILTDSMNKHALQVANK